MKLGAGWRLRVRASICGLALSVVSLQPLAAEEAAPPIPIRAFFENPDFESPRLSADGVTLAVLVSDGDRQVVATRPVAGGALRPIVRIDQPEMRLRWLEWANESRLLLSASVRLRADGISLRHFQLFGIDRDGANFRWLGEKWPRYGVGGVYQVQFQDEIIDWLRSDPKSVLLLYRPPFDGASVVRMNVDSGKIVTRQRPAHDIESWVTDASGEVRAGWSESREEYVLWARLPGGLLERVSRHLPSREDGPTLLAMHADPGKLYVAALQDGRQAVFEFDIANKRLGALVYAHPQTDVEGLVFSPDGSGRVIGATLGSGEVHYFDAQLAKEHRGLDAALAAEFGRPVDHGIASQSDGGDRMILRVSADVQAAAYYLYDRSKKQLAHLFDQSPSLPAERMARMRPIAFVARDGLEIPGYLTLPLGSAGKSLPMIVLVHGGPWARDTLGWDDEVQAFASRGFAVLQVNFRGSTGYGKAFLEAGYRQWGEKIQDDISDGVKWAIAEGIADAGRVGIYGGSFGGYAALIGATKTPELYRAAAAYAAVTDVELLLDDGAKYSWGEAWRPAMIGGERGDASRIRASSPLRLAARAGVPILLGHGDEDDRVEVHHSRKMAEALRAAGKDVAYLEFPHEIHGFALEANRIRWYEALIAFFEKHLAPRPASATVATPTEAAPQ
jgi:dipeptidyl aminopeptidase/acylaminoacyl peptidase